MARGIPLHAREGTIRAFAMVDMDVYEWASRLTWHVHRGDQPYVARRLHVSRKEFLHRRVLGLAPDDPRRVDHINGDRMDNRRANLRLATVAQNAQNQGSRGGSSRYRGVSWDKSKSRWYAQAQVDGVKHNLGRFKTEEEAAEVVAAFRADHMPYSEEGRPACC